MSAVLKNGRTEMLIVSFKTITAAQRAGSLLREYGIDHSVVGIDPALTKRGCSYGLSLDNKDKNRALGLLSIRNIPYGDVFTK